MHPVRRQPVPRRARRRRWRGSVGSRVTASATGQNRILRRRRSVRVGWEWAGQAVSVLVRGRRGHAAPDGWSGPSGSSSGRGRCNRTAGDRAPARHGDRLLGHQRWPATARPGSGRYGGRTTSRSGARPISPNSRRFARWVTSMAMPAAQKSSSNSVAFFTAMPRPAASGREEWCRGEEIHRGGGAGMPASVPRPRHRRRC